MAEFSGLWTTGGATGDQQASYTQAQLAIMHKIIAACSGFEGVAPGFLNELAVAANGANTVSVATGGAMVDGIAYLNDASQNVNIPSAVGSGNTRIDRIVLRADWAGFNVSVHRIAGTDAASPTAPAITQNSGTTYDIMLAQVLVTTAGAVTVTDERTWASAIAINRQGGSATSWATGGTTNYPALPGRIQAGTRAVPTAGSAGAFPITFPEAFDNIPLVFVGVGTNDKVAVAADSVTTTQFRISWWMIDGGIDTPTLTWFAIGQA